MSHRPRNLQPRNLLQKELTVRHACPECDIRKPKPFCTVCHGEGNVTELQLAIWERNQQAGW